MHRTSRLLQQRLAAKADSIASAMSHALSTLCAPASDFGDGRWVPALTSTQSASGNASRRIAPSSRCRTPIDRTGAFHASAAWLPGGAPGPTGSTTTWTTSVLACHSASSGTTPFWFPIFQFDMPGPTVATGPLKVVAELRHSLDGWALANWFVQTRTDPGKLVWRRWIHPRRCRTVRCRASVRNRNRSVNAPVRS